ncbi:MAG: hypothetical protein WDA20_05890 [Desulfuromonadales bacterium]
MLLAEIRSRLRYLVEVGLPYLTLDRQSRTLSGGEVQRINLTTALGTSLVNTLFVLDEPSTGLHPRDMGRVIAVLRRLRDAGNSLLVVEHDPQVMLAADRLLDIGPEGGDAGGQIVCAGPPAAVARHAGRHTGAALRAYAESSWKGAPGGLPATEAPDADNLGGPPRRKRWRQRGNHRPGPFSLPFCARAARLRPDCAGADFRRGEEKSRAPLGKKKIYYRFSYDLKPFPQRMVP